MQNSDITPRMRGKKRVGFDTRNTALPQGTGVAAYAATLTGICDRIGFTPQYLTARPIANALVQFLHAARPVIKIGQDFSAPNIYRVGQVHFNLYGRPMKLRTDNPPDLMHWTYPLPLYLAGCKNIVTIHDLIPLVQPHLTGINGARHRRLLRTLLDRFDGIVTVSEAVRNEIIKFFNISPTRVQTIYQPVDLTMLDRQADSACPPGSFLVVGSVERRKNIRRIIAAHKASNVAVPLVIIGPDGENAAEELAGMGSDVIRIPYVSRAVLLQTMRQARAILFPSLAEGFGLPIVEAFALGVPVMTSRGAATGEIAADAAILVNPLDSNEIAEQIRLLARDDELCATLVARGLARSQQFSRDACAENLSCYYNHILNS